MAEPVLSSSSSPEGVRMSAREAAAAWRSEASAFSSSFAEERKTEAEGMGWSQYVVREEMKGCWGCVMYACNGQ